MNVAIIPARGGSKRIPHKNIKMFCGKPMISWSIEAAMESGCFSRIIVSTDDDDIANVARTAGAEVPFRRPAALADDHAGTTSVIAHATQWLIDQDWKPENVCCIYATAPFIELEDLSSGLSALVANEADYAFSVTSYQFPIQRALRIGNDGRVAMFYPEYSDTRSQDLEEAWHDAGQFYWGKSDAWLAQRPIFSTLTVPVVLPRYRVQDIDNKEDWVQAEHMFYQIRGTR